MTDSRTQQKWDRLAPYFDLMNGFGAELRWAEPKQRLYQQMGDGAILFMALGTGLDIAQFPPGKNITAIDISPAMLAKAADRVQAYPGQLSALQMDVHAMDFAPESFDQVFTSCTFCSVPNPVEALQAVKRVLKPGGELKMFEHTGSRWFPFNLMLHLMTPLSRSIGPDMNRPTPDNVRRAGFELLSVENVYLDVVRCIHARKPS